jgi:uncharacterized repeat protein (TIGR03803 family)
MYGTALYGGAHANGTVFSMTNDGTGFKVLYTFTADPTGNNDGSNPNGLMVLANGHLYGTTRFGGAFDDGVVFSLSTNGSSQTVIYTFPDAFTNSVGVYTNVAGFDPVAGMVLGGARFYGTAYVGGLWGNGTLFALTTNATPVFTNLHTFTALDPNTGTNIDGANPASELLVSGGTLYGTTTYGGYFDQGVVFAVSTNGTGFQVLHHFNGAGAGPTAGLVLSGSTLYGIGGSEVFALNTNGTGFRVVYQFNQTVGNPDTLCLSGGTLFGASDGLGFFGSGMAFSVGTNSSAFADFHDFTPTSYPSGTNIDGALPNGVSLWTNGLIYGVASAGGTGGSGTIFSAAGPITITPQRSGTNFSISFQTAVTHNYTVQQTTNLSSTNWTLFTNFAGSGSVTQFMVPTAIVPRLFFRVRMS